jgi:inorganic pyrophosphatase
MQTGTAARGFAAVVLVRFVVCVIGTEIVVRRLHTVRVIEMRATVIRHRARELTEHESRHEQQQENQALQGKSHAARVSQRIRMDWAGVSAPMNTGIRALMDLAAHDPQTGLVRVVIDTPKGSRNKYKFDEELGVFKLSRILPDGMAFPFDFGSIPGTKAEDGDALDVIVLTEAALFVGCLVHVRLLGVLRATQTEGRKTLRNDRLIGAVQTPVNEPCARTLAQLGATRLRAIEHFFVAYNQAQGRRFRISGRAGASAARKLLSSCGQQPDPRKKSNG